MGQRIQGTEDLYGGYMRSWERMQDIARHLFGTYGFDRIETPAIEQVDTFVHGIGESTDVVRKEMFRVFSGALMEDLLASGSEAGLKPRQRMAMRPEGTAGVVRAAVEHNFVPQGAAPAKMWYAEAMFRGERPQKGRLRQFHQVGVEWLGASDPAADAESIIMFMQFFKELGFDTSRLKLMINSMGDSECRPAYREKVKQFILDHADHMCDDCTERAEINPLRAFDCKNESCQAVMKDAPLISDNLCDDCRAHYEQVKAYLDAAGIAYVEDPTLVRGLDYYTRTVFEVEALDAGVGAIGGGGRYDGLMELEGESLRRALALPSALSASCWRWRRRALKRISQLLVACTLQLPLPKKRVRHFLSCSHFVVPASARKPIAQAALSKLSSSRQISWEQSFVWCWGPMR